MIPPEYFPAYFVASFGGYCAFQAYRAVYRRESVIKREMARIEGICSPEEARVTAEAVAGFVLWLHTVAAVLTCAWAL